MTFQIARHTKEIYHYLLYPIRSISLYCHYGEDLNINAKYMLDNYYNTDENWQYNNFDDSKVGMTMIYSYPYNWLNIDLYLMDINN